MGGPEGERLPVNIDELTTLALTGYGHFTTMLVEHGAVRGLSLHLARLVRDCRTVFDAELDQELVRRELLRATGSGPAAIVARVTVFDPALSLAHPSAPSKPRILVTTRPAPPPQPDPLRAQPVRYLRQLAAVKHVGLFESLYLRRAAQLDGFDDALYFSDDRGISEGATWNVGFVDGDQVVWPQAEHLPGVTMALLRQSRGRGLTRPVAVDQLPSMQAAFATNAATGVRPIAAIGAVRFAVDHPALAELNACYAAVVPESLR